MGEGQLQTPVALFLFKRPDRTRLVFDRIRDVRPTRLFLIADGPLAPEDQPGCEQARSVVEAVDWPCEVTRNFAADNLGLKRGSPRGSTRSSGRSTGRSSSRTIACRIRPSSRIATSCSIDTPRTSGSCMWPGASSCVVRRLTRATTSPATSTSGDGRRGDAPGSTSTSSCATGTGSTAIPGKLGSGRCSPKSQSAATGATSGTTAARSRTGMPSGPTPSLPERAWRRPRTAT